VINPALNSVPYTFLLTTNISALKKSSAKAMSLNALFDKIEGFLLSFDARQMRYLGSEFATIIDSFVSMAHHKQMVCRCTNSMCDLANSLSHGQPSDQLRQHFLR
jgi:hypothetical protein